MSCISRLRHQELLRRHQFTLEDSLERLDGAERSESKQKEREKAKVLRSGDQTWSDRQRIVAQAAEATAHRAACQLAEAWGIFCEWSAQKCREMQGSVGNYAWWYVWAPVTCLRFCDEDRRREGAKSKRKVEGGESFYSVCNRLQ